MDIDIIKTVSNKCVEIVNDCIHHRNVNGIVCNHGVVISLDELKRDRATVQLMNQVTGLMKSYGVKNARYQKDSRRFFGVVRLDTAVLTPGNIPLVNRTEPIVYVNDTVIQPKRNNQQT